MVVFDEGSTDSVLSIEVNKESVKENSNWKTRMSN